MTQNARSTTRRLLARDGQSLTADLTANFQHARLLGFIALWQSAIEPGRTVPSRDAFTPELLREYLPYLIVIGTDESRQRYRFRLVGTEVVAMNGRDGTGKWLDELYSPADMEQHHRVHQALIATSKPMRVAGTLGFVDRSYIAMEAAVVPLASATPDYVDQFMICMAYGELRQPSD